ncbi:hypothetical protein NliqN6_5750 [Naganishia liquefaciens]|uniref:BolA family transcriptional regulator n=1 Tax=Naganishia liquefaciens TaxID=104408 RepID=A0A8H3YHH0_9TREE|nr:hypothetical protein NliqN6_5750 [Naganishia liquefaciens]
MAESQQTADVSALPIDQQMEQILRTRLDVQELKITDISANCGNSFSIVVVSKDFEKKGTLARHRLINDMLAAQIKFLHAFSQKTYTPAQWEVEKQKLAAST